MRRVVESLVLVLVFAASARAGIVVYENGQVAIGRISPKDINAEAVTLNWPYKTRQERGSLVVPLDRIRWFHMTEDEPTKEYWDQFADEFIDPKYQRKIEHVPTDVELEEAQWVQSRLGDLPLEDQFWSMKIPRDWKWNRIDEHLIALVREEPTKHGYAPRIHVFSLERPHSSATDQIDWMVKALEERHTTVIESFRMRRRAKGGREQQLLTETLAGPLKIRAMRQVFVRGRRTYVFTGFAEARDWKLYRSLFAECLKSFTIKEDAGLGEGEE